VLLLIAYVLLALVVSFLCSIAEAVLLSITSPYVAVLEQEGKPSGSVLRELKADINQPLAAILTLNTIAHTVGAAGAGAQAAIVFGNAYLGIASAVLTLLILIFSEIIPKTLGAHHWRALAPAVGIGLKALVWLLYPFVILAEKLTSGMKEGPTLIGFNRQEFAAMAELSAKEGQLAVQESKVLKNLLLLRETRVEDVMTPRTVVFSLPDTTSIEVFFDQHDDVRFSRIPIFSGEADNVVGFVLRDDLLLAHARGHAETSLKNYQRDLPVLLERMTLSSAFNEVLRIRAHIALVVDEYGSPAGILTLEDILETLLGLEIVDESDEAIDMQEHARHLWRQRAKKLGLKLD
jgi:CBS domain containing-hemolysin-like protein